MSSFTDVFRTLSTDPNRRGKQFEAVTKHLLQCSQVYASMFRNVFLWDEWPLRDGPDIGIDLVAEMTGGGGWCAIQAKAYDSSYAIKKEDIDSFIAASPPERFVCRLLVATTNRIGTHASRTLQGNSNISVLLRTHIESVQINWPSSFEQLANGVLPSPRPSPEPYEFQKTAVQAATATLSQERRGQLIMPCGTGKTLMAYWILQGLKARRVLFVAPALSLVRKTLTTWAYQCGRLPPWLAVCSDESIAKGVATDPTLSESAEHLYDLSVPVTTDPQKIRPFLSAHKDCWLFSTYHSLPAIAESFAGGAIAPFDLAVCDEAHRLVGVPLETFGSVLEDSRIACQKRLFMTATPKTYRRLQGKRSLHIGTTSRDMSDRVVFGDIAHQVGLAEAIENKWLADYQVLVLVADASDADSLHSPSVRLVGSRGQALSRHGLAGALATLKAVASVGISRLVTFHGSIKKARDFHDALVELRTQTNTNNSKKLIVRHVHGGMSAARREEVLNSFAHIDANTCMIVTNARCLGEGVDVPTLDGICFADPKDSYVDIVQGVGRAIRASEDKAIATIIIPVVLRGNDNRNVGDAVKASAFRFVWQVLSAIRSHDSRLGEEIDAGAREYSRTGRNNGLPKRLKILNVSNVSLDANSLTAAVSARIYEAVALSDMYGMGKAEKYAAIHGRLNGISVDAVLDNFNLGRWVVRQRGRQRCGRIVPEIESRLDGLGIVWDPYEEKWTQIYSALTAWIDAQEGRSAAKVPEDLELEGMNLGVWLRLQRHGYRKNKLSQSRITRLEAIGIEWDPHDAKWRRAIQACQQWRDSGKDLSAVETDSTIDGYPIGTFITHQRSFYKKNMVSDERIKKLEDMGMVWDKKDSTWMMNFRMCEDYVATVGPISDVNANGAPYKNVAIGRWLHHQRQLAKKGKLREDRKSLLDTIGMNWVPDTMKAAKKNAPNDFVRWQEMLALCEEYVVAHPGQPIQAVTTFKGIGIGSWVRNNLHALRKGELAPERAALFEPRVASFRYRTRPRR